MSSEPTEKPVEAKACLTLGRITDRGAPANFAVPFSFPAFVPALPCQPMPASNFEGPLNLVSN